MSFKKYMVNNINSDSLWILLENNFNKYYTEIIENGVKIPKIIHQIWFGGEFPEKYKRFRDTWITKNPEWSYRLWTEDDIKSFNLENIDIFNKIENLGSKSDIFRYEILYRYGGVYIDTDFECLKSFNDLINLDFFTGTGHMSEPILFNGLIGCVPNHKIIRKLIDDIKFNLTAEYDEIMKLTGPYYFSNVFFEYLKNNIDERIVVFPTIFFYPLPAVNRYMVRNDNQNSREYIKKFISEKSYCVHLWYTSWQK